MAASINEDGSRNKNLELVTFISNFLLTVQRHPERTFTCKLVGRGGEIRGFCVEENGQWPLQEPTS